MTYIPYGRQDITEADIEAVVDVLRSDWLTQGPMVPRFEKAIADYCGADHGVAVNSATSALHIACLALDLGPGDWLWTSAVTFVASANCGRYCGANVDFVDIDPRSYNMCSKALARKLSEAEKAGKLPSIVVPVHLTGQPCDMAAIRELSKQYGFKIIEDASHAIGGSYRNKPIGNCQYSDITVFSFHPVKIITTAEGGVALTNDPAVAARMQQLRTHGITRDPALMSRAPDGPWYYEQIELGFNYRMTDIQAALGLSQIRRLDDYIARRREIARRYDEALAELPLTTPWQHTGSQSAWHLYVIRLKLNELEKTHKHIFEALREKGIGVNLHYIPLHLQPYFRAFDTTARNLPEAEQYYAEAISLPMFPTMTNEDQDRVVDALRETLE